jgi:protein NirF
MILRSLLLLSLSILASCASLRGTGDMGVVIERTTGSLQIIETTQRQALGRVEGLGDLSHASVVYSRDARYAYVFGRDGGLSKVDLLKVEISNRVIQSGNSIGGAISQDGHLIAVSNYSPGGVRIFDADSLQLIADIPAVYGDGQQRSKVVGLVDAPDQKFVFSLYDVGEIWMVDMTDVNKPAITRYRHVGRLPYDGMITQDGRYYLAGLFGEDGLVLLDLWHPERGVKRILAQYGKGDQKLPVYKMPHMEGWASTGDYLFVPAVGHHEVLVIDKHSWRQVKKIPVHGQPVFVMARPDDHQVWVNFAHPLNDTVQVIDTESMQIIKTLTPGKAVLHMEFTPRGDQIWISVRDADRVDVYDTRTFKLINSLPMAKPSGIFLSVRAAKIGM